MTARASGEHRGDCLCSKDRIDLKIGCSFLTEGDRRITGTDREDAPAEGIAFGRCGRSHRCGDSRTGGIEFSGESDVTAIEIRLGVRN